MKETKYAQVTLVVKPSVKPDRKTLKQAGRQTYRQTEKDRKTPKQAGRQTY